MRYCVVLVSLLGLAACRPPARPAYRPRVRELTVTTVPLLVREARGVYPFLARAFGPGGVLEGKEVYAFSPSTFTVIEGDTVQFTIYNPEDDLHSFVLPGLAVALTGNSISRATYLAGEAGVFPIECNIAGHLPMMTGQLVVLPAATMAGH